MFSRFFYMTLHERSLILFIIFAIFTMIIINNKK